MRLLNTTTKQLTEFQSNIPDYAILSHVWETEEVTFQDIADLDKVKNMRGFAKVVGACDTALKDGFKYIWVDTCCINKESSAELSEAINSMYTWYKNACVCYAYLWDVPNGGEPENPGPPFAMSLWFTRGWTLQELIAPPRVVFYARDWVDIGTKATLQEVISAVTKIDKEVIAGGFTLDDVPIAVRMSWATDRDTTREEDVAYSLMGLFDVNMPLLYGEGKKAFIRLQHEIIKKSNDHSIFAWTSGGDRPQRRGILARSPEEFRHSGKVERIPPVSLGGTQPNGHSTDTPTPYSMTNQGLRIDLPIVVAFEHMKYKTLAFLNCRFPGKSDPIVITLVWSHQQQHYIRSETNMSLERTVKGSAQLSSLYIADDYQEVSLEPPISLELEVKVPPNYGDPIIMSDDMFGTRDRQRIFRVRDLGRANILVFYEPHKPEQFAVVVGSQRPGVVRCGILTGVKPMGRDIHIAYRTAAETHWATKQRSLDRASANLADGWSVTVSLASHSKFKFHGKVEIKRLQIPPLPLQRPSGRMGCIVIPPLPQCGFTVDTDSSQRKPSAENWVERFGSFVLYMGYGEVGALLFTNNNSGERFYLVLGRTSGMSHTDESVRSSIEDGAPGRSSGVFKLPSKAKAGAYSMILEQGKSVFVTQRGCRDTSVAHYIIIISM